MQKTSIIDKIKNSPRNFFIIFFSDDCQYCLRALNILKNNNLRFKSYDINKINGGMQYLLQVLSRHSREINFNPYHQTKPLIFLNGKFLGGMDDLIRYLNAKEQNNFNLGNNYLIGYNNRRSGINRRY